MQSVEGAGLGKAGEAWLGPAEVAAMGEVTQGKFVPRNAILLLLPVLTQPQGFQEGPQVWEEASENSCPPSGLQGPLWKK